MKKINLYDENGIISQEAMDELEKVGMSASCECPRHLVEILRSVKEFTKYQEDCLIEKPQDQVIHNWLKASSINIEHLLSGTIINLARLEGLIDHENKIETINE